ncbi:MAG: DnaA regulatory inactivator Hda [Methylococcales bacterium]|nr:DnaA regulatory inactivator Hda [Methylococcales bacterium]
MNRQLAVQFEYRSGNTFADYFPGDNQAATAHLQQAATGAGERHLHLYGGPALGKTHLLQACAQSAQDLGRTALYIPLKHPNLSLDLLEGLEHFELVLLDDIDAVVKQTGWEYALFNLYNRMYQAQHQLILSSRLSPKQLPVELPDLHTRLNWGLTLALSPLSDADMIAALQRKTLNMGCLLKPEAAQYLLSHYGREPWQLWRLLEKLDQAALSAKRKLTIPFIKEILTRPTDSAS